MKEGIGKKMLQYMETVSQGEAENIRNTGFIPADMHFTGEM